MFWFINGFGSGFREPGPWNTDLEIQFHLFVLYMYLHKMIYFDDWQFFLLSGIIWNKSQSTQNQKPEQLLPSRGEHNTPNTHSTPFFTITMPTHVTSHTKTSYIFIYFSPTHKKEINYTTTNHKQIFSSHAKFHFFFPKSWRVATQFSGICAQKCNQPLIVLLFSFKN
jgi:hypothetical protein